MQDYIAMLEPRCGVDKPVWTSLGAVILSRNAHVNILCSVPVSRVSGVVCNMQPLSLLSDSYTEAVTKDQRKFGSMSLMSCHPYHNSGYDPRYRSLFIKFELTLPRNIHLAFDEV